MCGIAGYIGKRELGQDAVDACLRLMRRRGPDHTAFQHRVNPAGSQVYLLHSRLSIIDLDERANQPFNIGAKSMVLNGELYNYVELRREMEARGVDLRTQSDTEVLLHAIDHDGWQVLDRCEGMWSFAVYNEADGSLTLCRDRFGEKPLYLYRDATGWYFGSEVKFIVALLGRRLEVKMDHLYRYMVNGYKALYKKPNAFFQGLEEVPAATTLRIAADGSATPHAYWTPRCSVRDGMSYEEAVSGARARLIRSVELRLRADVPMAFCMSGGVDSNALIGIAKRVFNYDVHGFTILNTDKRYEEKDMVDEVVRELGLRHTYIPVETQDFLPRLRTLVRQHDAPVYTITYFAHWALMASVASHGYRISVSGSAADELFTGYYDHHLAYLYEIASQPGLHAAAREAWIKHIKPIVRNPFLGNPDLFLNDPTFRDHIFLEAAEFSAFLTKPWSEPFAESSYSPHLLQNRMLNELFHEATPVILHEDDLNAMYYSIENRSPFLDRNLFEFCFSIPPRHLVRDGRAKSVLRDAIQGLVPDSVRLNRRKVGFNVPIFDYLDVKDPAVRAYLLDDSPIFEHVRKDRIAELITRSDLPNSQSKFLFYFLNAKMFLEEFGS